MRRRVAWLILALGLPSMMTGCGGFSGSQGVSPATILAPGMVENSHPAVSAAAQPQSQMAANTAVNTTPSIR